MVRDLSKSEKGYHLQAHRSEFRLRYVNFDDVKMTH